MNISLKNKTALVTGASKGVGKGIALELARLGANIAVNFNSDEAGAMETVRLIEAMGVEALAVQADVSSSSAVENMFHTVLRRFSQLNILVNNAGMQTWKSLLDLTEPEWDRVLDTNLKGSFLCTQQAARFMKKRRRQHYPYRFRLQQIRFPDAGKLYSQQRRH